MTGRSGFADKNGNTPKGIVHHKNIRIACGFPSELFNNISIYAEQRNISFSHAVRELTAKGLPRV